VPANDDIRDAELRHHIGIQRLSSAVARDVLRVVAESDAEIVAKLQARGATLEGTFTSVRLVSLLRSIREINTEAHVIIGRNLRSDLADVARYEAEFQEALLNRALRVEVDWVSPTAPMLDAVVTQKPFDGKLLADAVRTMGQNKFKALQEAIQKGMIQGETVDQIVRRVRGSPSLNYRDGVMRLGRTSAERLVRTATNHVSNAAREIMFEENKDYIKGVQWVATLDTRTCMRCAALDGKTFKVGSGPRPPYHWNCRCTVAPVTKTWREMGIDIDEAPPGTRASINGQVSETETFQTWLKKQPASVQDEALGPTRGRMFRSGEIDIDRFVDTRGNQLTLDELRERES
jgi:SPP1 gp7 family putative phage head morphogenesis protein